MHAERHSGEIILNSESDWFNNIIIHTFTFLCLWAQPYNQSLCCMKWSYHCSYTIIRQLRPNSNADRRLALFLVPSITFLQRHPDTANVRFSCSTAFVVESRRFVCRVLGWLVFFFFLKYHCVMVQFSWNVQSCKVFACEALGCRSLDRVTADWWLFHSAI